MLSINNPSLSSNNHSLYQHRRDRNLSPLTLVPRRPPETSLDFSVPYKTEVLDESMRRIHDFVAASPRLQGRVNDVMLTCEEIMKNIIQYLRGDC
jgi:hypothetical protein